MLRRLASCHNSASGVNCCQQFTPEAELAKRFCCSQAHSAETSAASCAAGESAREISCRRPPLERFCSSGVAWKSGCPTRESKRISAETLAVSFAEGGSAREISCNRPPLERFCSSGVASKYVCTLQRR